MHSSAPTARKEKKTGGEAVLNRPIKRALTFGVWSKLAFGWPESRTVRTVSTGHVRIVRYKKFVRLSLPTGPSQTPVCTRRSISFSVSYFLVTEFRNFYQSK